MAAPWEIIRQTVSRDNFGDSYPNYIRVRFYKETGQNILIYALHASDSDSRYTTTSQFWTGGYDFVNYRYAFYIAERETQTKKILETMPEKDGDFLYTVLTPPIPTEPGATIVVARQLKNQNPTIILSTQDNITLTDGSVLPIAGSASDADSGDVLTVKYKIDNGTVRNIASGVASGTPLSFAKNLTFSNKRLRDGATEVTGDLAENVDHILTVWAEDDKGGKSTEVIRKFRVIHNRPPIISGTNEDLGTIQAPPSKTYTVSDAENDTFTVTEKINGKVIRSFAGVAGQENTITIPHDLWIRLQPGVQHTLAIEATDSKGMTAARTYIFVRQENKLEFKLKKPFVTDIAAKRILVTIDAVVPNGAMMKIEACNNAFDASPTWEDITNHVRFNRGFLFTNTEKTAEQWGVDIRFVFEKGTATSQVIVNGFGGAFD